MKKGDIIDFIKEKLNDDIELLLKEIYELKEDKKRDTKSSAGDKFETSTEMINQSEKLLVERLEKFNRSKQIVESFSENSAQNVTYGSLVTTNKAIFIFGINLPKLNIDDQWVIPISFASPLGKAFQNKKVDEQVKFNGVVYKIISID